nr:uncharacterized protein LOC112730382 [Arachis hypogaea]
MIDKLNESSFKTWQHLALHVINANELVDHLNPEKIPTKFDNEAARIAGTESESYKKWKTKDHYLTTWLLSSIDDSFKNRMLDCAFCTPTSGYTLSLDDHITAITEGLSEDYALYIFDVMVNIESISLMEAESLLLAHEHMFDCFRKPDFGSISANYTQTTPPYARPPSRANFYGRRGRGGRFSRGDRYSSLDYRLQCQITKEILLQGIPRNGIYHFDRVAITQTKSDNADKNLVQIDNFYPKALQSPHWHQVMLEELQALYKNQTWSLETPPPIAKGNHQVEGVDYEQVFAPIIKPSSIRIVLTIALKYHWQIRQFDFNNAFLNGNLNEVVFMKQPPEFSQGDVG